VFRTGESTDDSGRTKGGRVSKTGSTVWCGRLVRGGGLSLSVYLGGGSGRGIGGNHIGSETG